MVRRGRGRGVISLNTIYRNDKIEDNKNSGNYLLHEKKEYKYAILLQDNGYIYEGMFNNKRMNGFGLRILPDGEIEIGYFEDYIIKNYVEIYEHIQGRLLNEIKNRGIEKSLFLGEEKIRKQESAIKSPEEKWATKNYCGYGIYLQDDGYIYEGIFQNNWINGLGMFISSNGKVKQGYYNNFRIKGSGEIFSEMEDEFLKEIKKRNIDMSCFIGNEKLIDGQYYGTFTICNSDIFTK